MKKRSGRSDDSKAVVRKWQEMSDVAFRQLKRGELREDLLAAYDSECRRRKEKRPPQLAIEAGKAERKKQLRTKKREQSYKFEGTCAYCGKQYRSMLRPSKHVRCQSCGKSVLENNSKDVSSTRLPSFQHLQDVLLHSESLEDKVQAVHDLAALGSPDAMHEILETLKDPDGEMTMHATLALATFGETAVLLLKSALDTWGTTAVHPSRNMPLNIRERVLYTLGLLGAEGRAVLESAVHNENAAVRVSASDLLAVIERPIEFPNNVIRPEPIVSHLKWQAPTRVVMDYKSIQLCTEHVSPVVTSVLAILCAHQGLFGSGLRGNRMIGSIYNISTLPIMLKDRSYHSNDAKRNPSSSSRNEKKTSKIRKNVTTEQLSEDKRLATLCALLLAHADTIVSLLCLESIPEFLRNPIP